MSVRLHSTGFDPWSELATQARALDVGAHGAEASFIGTMRSSNEGDAVVELHLEHYPGMTERVLDELEIQTRQRWPLLDVLIRHRIGTVHPGEPIVLCAAWSAHRAAAFDACRHLMEVLKYQAPFWKKETLMDGTARWVDRNTPG